MRYPILLCLGIYVSVCSATKKNIHTHKNNKHCRRNLNVVNFSLRDMYCEQPLFVNFVQRSDDNLMLDNICHTLFPLPDDPTTFQVYISKVYCDGSSELISFIATQMETGISKSGSPYCTFTDTVFGYAGCDTYLTYRCFEFGDCGSINGTMVYGISKSCNPIGLSCLKKIQEVVEEAKLDDVDYYMLPMQLPNRCVTQQLCLKPDNPFYNHLPGHRGKSHILHVLADEL